MSKKRSRAGTKAVTPSRRRGGNRARSLAAKKGWQTRRAQAKKRSDAARKGWKTRLRTTRARVRGVRRAGRIMAEAERARQKIHGPIARSEYAVSADYRSRRLGSSVSVQISAIGPAGATKTDAQNAVEHAVAHRGQSPAGWSIRLIDWKDKDAWRKLRKPLEHARLESSRIR